VARKRRCISALVYPLAQIANLRRCRFVQYRFDVFHLVTSGFIPGCRIIGVSLDNLDADGFRKLAHEALNQFSARKVSQNDWTAFAEILDYLPLSARADALKQTVEKAEQALGGESRRIHYLSVPPKAALSAVRLLQQADLVAHSRVIMEKPFGIDLASAKRLNAELHEVFSENQIFRIDHFLGKEPAQNILAFRFANGLFEPIWNRNFIDHVQIDVPETLGLGKRAAFYETTGAFRDMVVKHLFQILAFMAMEPPTSLEPIPISEEKQGVPLDAAARSPRRGAWPVCGLSARGRHRSGIRYRNADRTQVRDRQLALGRRAVFFAHRQENGRRPAHHFDRVPRAAKKHVSGRFGRRRAGSGSPDL
jgi:hypothetical protein